MAIPIDLRKKMRKQFPYGSFSKIAKDLGVSRQYICQYMSGRRNSTKIENAIIQEFESIRKEELRKINLVNGLIEGI